MLISLTEAGKRYNREWIFRNASLQFSSGNSYAITGPNGSGKSTFLQCVGGLLALSAGKIHFSDTELPAEKIYQQLSFCAPYLEVLEEMTLLEFLTFHQAFKPFLNGYDVMQVADIVALTGAVHKQIRFYSSGMKQRVKLAQAIFSDTALLMLDEPCTNLDQHGVAQYHQWMEEYGKNRMIFVASNDEREYYFCKEQLVIEDYK